MTCSAAPSNGIWCMNPQKKENEMWYMNKEWKWEAIRTGTKGESENESDEKRWKMFSALKVQNWKRDVVYKDWRRERDANRTTERTTIDQEEKTKKNDALHNPKTKKMERDITRSKTGSDPDKAIEISVTWFWASRTCKNPPPSFPVFFIYSVSTFNFSPLLFPDIIFFLPSFFFQHLFFLLLLLS